MPPTTQPLKRIELLLNTLRAERYVRRALLTELVDELDDSAAYAEAARAARALLERLERLDEAQYERGIASVWDLAVVPPSGVRLATPGAHPGAAARTQLG
jgi:hypothetical protein